jgi:hypothetical protein
MLAAIRREGARDEDIRVWWNMPDLDRRMMLYFDEAYRVALYVERREYGHSCDEASARVWKCFAMYGDPDDTSKSSGEDRPIPYELKIRVNAYMVKRMQQDPVGYKAEIEGASTFNALVRKWIRNGQL